MKKLFSWLIKPVVLALIGVLLLSLVIWFEAPLLSFDGSAPFESESARWTLILLLFLAWAGWVAWRVVSARLANIKLMKSVAGEDQAAPSGAKESAAEIEQLNKRMQEAMAILRKGTKDGKKGGLY